MKELAKNELGYFKLEEASEVDGFHVKSEGDGFEFFRGLGIIGYEKTFKMWLRKFPRPVFIVAAEGRDIVSWLFIEEWPEGSKDGSSVYVLRAVETLPRLRSKRIGYKLLLLGLRQVNGYLLTKPITPEGERFFKRMGFMDDKEIKNPPVDMARSPGYLILPPHKRKQLLEESEMYFRG